MARSRSTMALGFGLLAWITLLFSPLAFVQTVQAEDVDSYGTVIGIVSSSGLVAGHELVANLRRIWEPPTAVSV